MKKVLMILVALVCFGINANAQPAMGAGAPQEGMDGIDAGLMHNDKMYSGFMVSVNSMNPDTKRKLNDAAGKYRTKNRGAVDIGASMLTGGVTAIVNVLTTEIINLTKLRSKQKQEWMNMRRKECIFIDSLSSVNGQSDFYNKQSVHGPLDPTDMNFDGITFKATRCGKDVLKMVCHIDTSRINNIFLHSKFYLVVDTIQFHPYESFLPNFSANQIREPQQNGSQELKDYWETIKNFSFDDAQSMNLTINMDISSSWINELVQLHSNVKLGTFTVNLTISKNDIVNGVYTYIRSEAIAKNQRLVDMDGDCFVVPRSYMPVSATEPSWGTGEYKMKVTFSQRANYNGNCARAKDWHRDYKMMQKMRGKKGNEYITNFISTFRDNKSTIFKAVYTPLVSAVTNQTTTFIDNSLGVTASGEKAGVATIQAVGGAAATPAAGNGQTISTGAMTQMP